jgi:hypothetical protein
MWESFAMATTDRPAIPTTWKDRLQAILAEIHEASDQDLPDESVWPEISTTIEELHQVWHRRSAKALIERIRARVPADMSEEEIDAFTDEVIADVRAKRNARGL